MKKEVQVDKNMVLLLVLCGTIMSVIDGTAVNIALPSITKYFDVSLVTSQWVVTSYLFALTALLLIFGKVAEYTGRAKLFSLGIGTFTLGSLACGLSPSLPILIGFRVLQAIGAAMMFSISSAIIFHTFPRNEQGKAMGYIGSVVAAGGLVGPTLGGIVVDTLGWKYIFLINVPIGIAQLLLSSRYMPIDKPEITNSKILDTDVFKYRGFMLPLFAMIGMFVAIRIVSIVCPFYFQDTLGYSASFVGVIYLIMSGVTIIGSPIVGNFYDKYESKYLATMGLAVIAVSLFAQGYLTAKVVNDAYVFLLVFVLMGIGSCLFQSPNNTEVMRALPASKLNAASSITATARNLGMTIGAIVTGFLIPYLGFADCIYVAGLICVGCVLISSKRL